MKAGEIYDEMEKFYLDWLSLVNERLSELGPVTTPITTLHLKNVSMLRKEKACVLASLDKLYSLQLPKQASCQGDKPSD